MPRSVFSPTSLCFVARSKQRFPFSAIIAARERLLNCMTRKRRSNARYVEADHERFMIPRDRKSSKALTFFFVIFLSRPRRPPFFIAKKKKKKNAPHRASAPSARSRETRSSSPLPQARPTPSATSAPTSACLSSARPRCSRARWERSTASSASPARRTARPSRSRTGPCRASGAPSCRTCRWSGSWARARPRSRRLRRGPLRGPSRSTSEKKSNSRFRFFSSREREPFSLSVLWGEADDLFDRMKGDQKGRGNHAC